MSDRNWLDDQLDRANREVQSWNEWKRDAMRRKATSSAARREVSRGDTARAAAATLGDARSRPTPSKE